MAKTLKYQTKRHFQVYRFSLCISVTAEKDLENAQLVQILHRLLSDDRSAPEIKYNSMVLICALIGSGEYSGRGAFLRDFYHKIFVA